MKKNRVYREENSEDQIAAATPYIQTLQEGDLMKTVDLKELIVNGDKIEFERAFIHIEENSNEDWKVYLYGSNENEMIDFFTNQDKVNLKMVSEHGEEYSGEAIAPGIDRFEGTGKLNGISI